MNSLIPKISVIIPVYNVAEYIITCISSVTAQTFKDFELLVIDDCSQDNSIDLAEKYLANNAAINWRIIKHEKNKGLSAARNSGIDEAQGQFIMFIDSDDWIPNNTLEIFYREIVKHPQSIICGNTIAVTDIVKSPYWVKLTERIIFKKEEAIERMLVYNQILDTAWAKMYPRNLFLDHNIRFPVGFYFEDTPTNVRLFNNSESIIGIPHDVYYYRQNRAGSILQEKSMKSATDRVLVFENIYNYVVKDTQVNKEFALNYYLLRLVREYTCVFKEYKLSPKDQYTLAQNISAKILQLKKANKNVSFRKQIGIKFNVLTHQYFYKNAFLFSILHNGVYSVIDSFL